MKEKFKPKNPQKYKGDPTNIIYRSSWELRVMLFLDQNPNILEWGSEEIAIEYRNPIDNKIRRYFPDFWVKIKDKNGNIKIQIIEVKPKKETVKPELKKGKRKKTHMYEVMTYATNKRKWQAATEYCKKKNWEFKLLTEDNLPLLQNK